ncbi:hypothetical protein CCS01_12265 [Rhodopila globiformis]|uniref:Uncharacterized protein n=2 Tax=Rhodopila globiformis TaxID=1071 RepID=A0A2S6NHP8_RHOGL|nr:hypothetical protein CCS01_12265 [Rhodopila globiformis]
MHLHIGLLLSLTASPALAVPLDIHASNIAPSDTQSAMAPALPTPAVGLSAPPITFLRAARLSLAGGRTGEAQEALERAETRLLDDNAQPEMAAPPALADTRAARQALAVHDREGAARNVDAAIAALSTPAVAVTFPPQVAAPVQIQPVAPAVVAALPPAPPPVTKALLPGRWELRGAKYVWVPPDTELRRVDERSWLQGRYVWKDGAWIWSAVHYGYP